MAERIVRHRCDSREYGSLLFDFEMGFNLAKNEFWSPYLDSQLQYILCEARPNFVTCTFSARY